MGNKNQKFISIISISWSWIADQKNKKCLHKSLENNVLLYKVNYTWSLWAICDGNQGSINITKDIGMLLWI